MTFEEYVMNVLDPDIPISALESAWNAAYHEGMLRASILVGECPCYYDQEDIAKAISEEAEKL